MFGSQSSFGTPSTPSFSTPQLFGTPFSQPSQPQQQQQTPSLFQTPQQSLFQTPQQQQTPSLFQTPQQQQTPSLFQTPQQQQTTSLFQTPQQQQTTSFFQTPQPQQQQQNLSFPTSSFNAATQFQLTPYNVPAFGNPQLTTQMAPVAPLSLSLVDRDIHAIVEAYKEDPGNPKYTFKHLLFSVTEPQYRIKPAGVSDVLWAEAMAKLEGMESSKRERLWPQLVHGFKDLSQRLKLQDEVTLSDSERLRMTQSNVKMLQRHFQADTLPLIQRMQQKEHGLQRRLLRVMRVIEALEGKGSHLPMMKAEVDLAEKLAAITRQLKGSGAELSRRVQNLLSISRLQADGLNAGLVYLPGSTKIHEQSLADMQEVLQQQTEAIARLGNVLKRDMRDMEIIMAEDTEMTEE